MPKRSQPHDVFKFLDIPTDGEGNVLPSTDDNGQPINCWVWTGALYGVDKRPAYRIYGKRVTAYRLVYEISSGLAIPEGHVIRHKCDNPLCCNPAHLEPGTRKQNMQDMVERDRHRGAGLDKVKAARAMMEDGATDEAVAHTLAMSVRWANDIRNMKRYFNIPWPWGEYRLKVFRGVDMQKIRDNDLIKEYQQSTPLALDKLKEL